MAGETAHAYAVMPVGDAYSIGEFLDAAEGLKAATGPEWFSTPLRLPSAPESAPVKTQKPKTAKARGGRSSCLTRLRKASGISSHQLRWHTAPGWGES